jgi:CRISPR-associated protein Cas2
MWMFVMFDLPVTTAEHRKQYAQFRKSLLEMGFNMLQFSVYARYFVSEEAATVYRLRIRAALPPEGQVRLLTVTDCQFGRMESYIGKMASPTEKPPEQLLLF